MKCLIHNDNWDDFGIEYIVHSYRRHENSTAATVELESPDGTMITKVVAYHQIEWIEEDES